MTPRTPLEHALHYALDLRRPVIPLQPRGKAPLTPRGLRDATMRESIIRAWWARTPTANIGILCGFGVLVLDVDGPEGKASLRELERRFSNLPTTVESTTGRGRHLHFGIEGPMRPTAHALGPGLDTRADDSYIVAPPSIHASGRPYRWVREAGRYPLADAPEWLIALLRGPKSGGTTCGFPHGGAAGGTHKSSPSPRGPDRSLSGDDARLAVTMANGGASDAEIEGALRRTAARKGPHADDYVARTIAFARAGSVEARITRAEVQRLGAYLGMPPLTRIRLRLVSIDGEHIAANVVVPDEHHRSAGPIFQAVMPSDVSPETFATHDGAMRAVRQLVGRRLEVAVRNGQVRWMRALDAPRERKANEWRTA